MKKSLKAIQKEKSGDGWQNKSFSFSEIQQIFRENNILDEKISIEHEGKLYRLWCSDQSFIVYRVNCHQHIPPGIPGWIVCQVSNSSNCSDCQVSSAMPGHLQCNVKLNEWMDKIQQYCRENPV